MLVTYDGIVIARREAGDSGVYLDILTDEEGLIEAAARGAKKLNSGLLSSSALFSYSTFCFSCSKQRYTLNSAKPKYSFHKLGEDIKRLALACYFAQAVKYCTPELQPQESMVRFFAVSLFETLRSECLENVRAAFELRYSAMLGFCPNLIACENCGIYEHKEMFFLPDTGEIFCGGCFDRSYNGTYFKLSPDTLGVMRNIIFSPLNKAFKFQISGRDAESLYQTAEGYFLWQTDKTFSALDYYKRI